MINTKSKVCDTSKIQQKKDIWRLHVKAVFLTRQSGMTPERVMFEETLRMGGGSHAGTYRESCLG